MIALVVICSIVLLLLGYIFYGKFVASKLDLDDTKITPACELNDGVDYVPAKYTMLIGQHFSAIAAAGPIVGPILAGLWFGWLPAVLWIVIGSIFVGGVHDFTSLLASIRHKASSIGEVVKKYMSPSSHIIFLIFIWLTLVYVVIAFTDITAQTFVNTTSNDALGAGVAVASFFYLFLGVVLGLILYFFKVNLKIATAIFIPLLVIIIYNCASLPQPVAAALNSISIKQWDMILLAYCFVASLIPMWMLLQPRGYLGGWFLYLTIAISVIGSLFGGFSLQYPAFNTEGLKSLENGKYLFPLLFITIACGACSGFHGIVSSGTTSKQIEKESDTKRVGYGAMLLEGVVAVLALATLMILPKGSADLKADPNMIYARGIAKYLGMIGVNPNLALSFALLAFSTFVYDTLDVCTRLGRYIIEELFGLKGKFAGAIATFITLIIPFVFLMFTTEKAYLVAWPIFGSSNQLLASLILLGICVWLFKTGKQIWYVVIPMLLMLVMTIWSLVLLMIPFFKDLPNFFANLKPNDLISGIVGLFLFLMSAFIIAEAVDILVIKRYFKKAALEEGKLNP
jgi:carbon starvation protein